MDTQAAKDKAVKIVYPVRKRIAWALKASARPVGFFLIFVLFARAATQDSWLVFTWIYGILAGIQLIGMLVTSVLARQEYDEFKAADNALSDKFDDHTEREHKPYDRYKRPI